MTKDIASPALSRDDWDFSNVSEREIDACFVWECAREWESTFETISDLYGHLKEYPLDELRLDLESESGIQNVDILSDIAYQLPDSWQSLPHRQRSEAARRLLSIFFEIDDEARQWGKQRGKGQQIARFCITWRASDAQLIEEFAEWLNNTRQEKAVEVRGSSTRDRLKMIGAMRLLHCYTVQEAIRVTEDTLGKPLYATRPSWERARKGALDAFRTRFLYDWRSWETPPFPKSYPKHSYTKSVSDK